MFLSQETLGGPRSPTRIRGVSDEEISLHRGLIPAPGVDSAKKLTIDLVSATGQRALICQLINRMYGWRGYGSDHQLIVKEGISTFAATVDDEVVGTLTLAVDGKDGLTADKTFPLEVRRARETPGARLCELTKFACQPTENSRDLLGALFHTIFIFGTRLYDCTDLFIEVNPRHVRFYEQMLGFARVGPLRTNTAVDAPSQLMCLPVAEIGRLIDLYAGSDRYNGARTLYPNFLSSAEASEVDLQCSTLLIGAPRRSGKITELVSHSSVQQINSAKLDSHLDRAA
jgi:hypothetical protein